MERPQLVKELDTISYTKATGIPKTSVVVMESSTGDAQIEPAKEEFMQQLKKMLNYLWLTL